MSLITLFSAVFTTMMLACYAEHPVITVVGKILWERSVRQEKRTTMGEMRKLGTLLKAANDISAKDDFTGTDMLHPTNFRTVVEALNFITAKEDNSIKAGLKLSLGYLLKKAARFTKCELIIDGTATNVGIVISRWFSNVSASTATDVGTVISLWFGDVSARTSTEVGTAEISR